MPRRWNERWLSAVAELDEIVRLGRYYPLRAHPGAPFDLVEGIRITVEADGTSYIDVRVYDGPRGEPEYTSRQLRPREIAERIMEGISDLLGEPLSNFVRIVWLVQDRDGTVLGQRVHREPGG